jgi:hypothetical protein
MTTTTLTHAEVRRLRAAVLESEFAKDPDLGAQFYEFLCYQQIHLITLIVADRAAHLEGKNIPSSGQ